MNSNGRQTNGVEGKPVSSGCCVAVVEARAGAAAAERNDANIDATRANEGR